MCRTLILCVCILVNCSVAAAADGNRLTYLDEFCDPYYPHRTFPKLTTPQWVGEKDVECVVVLAIDDMREPEKYETYLRPILDRLKQIDGRAPVSIMTCQADPKNERLQQWLKEGLSLEVHTFDHPCPCLAGGDFAKSKATYDKCVDLMNEIPGNKPVAFRMPCCDSLNTPSPRFWMEAFNKTTEQGHYLSIDTSVFNIITGNDTSLPREITHNEQGEERFRRYVPFKSFVNTIEDYPYPYVIGKLCWQFPCVVPSDWSAQHVQKPNNPDTVRDLKLALDACVIKQGVYNLVFHPHGWIRNDQIVELIDHAVAKHGKKVKFLNFRECDEKLRKNLLAGETLRDPKEFKRSPLGGDNGVRLLDANGDGYMDVIIGKRMRRWTEETWENREGKTRIWDPQKREWLEGTFPEEIDASGPRFGIILRDGRTSMLGRHTGIQHLVGTEWIEAEGVGPPLQTNSDKGISSDDEGVRLRDIDHDGICECVQRRESVFQWDETKRGWKQAKFKIPFEYAVVRSGYRFVDLDGDNDDDIIVSTATQQGVWLFDSLETGWKKLNPSQDFTIPLISRNDANNGAFIHSGHFWWQNEDTNRLPDHVDRRSFAQLLGDNTDTNPKRERGTDDTNPKRERGSDPQEPKKEDKARQVGNLPTITPTDRKSAEGQEASDERIKAMGEAKSPEEALKSIVVKNGFKVELVAAEPLVVDPVAFDWGPDGRLWVVEMRDYPRGLDEQGQPGGRVKVLTDKDGDGKYDEAQLFLDDLPFPTGIKVWRKGVLVTAAPEILYAEDTDGDGQADVRKTLYRGFGEGNQQHRVNGLRWGLDNWLYIGNGDSGGKVESVLNHSAVDISGRDLRIRPDTGDIDPVSGATQFSLAFDDFGNRFGGNNSNPVWHYLLEDYHLRRNPHVKPPPVRQQISQEPGTAKIYPLSKTVTRFNDYHAANRFTSACGIEIYRDDYLGGEYYGNSFVCEPVHNLVHREVVEPKGVTFTSQRARDEQESEFLASTDNWFRPVMARTGPDGALYIADMYRLVIEHPTWIPEDWQKKLNLRAGDDKGRIYRVVRDDKPPRTLEPLDKLDAKQLALELRSPSGTRRDLAQQLLLWRNDKEAVNTLQELAQADEKSAVHALWTLAGMRALERRDILFALRDGSAPTRAQALRIAAHYFPADEVLEEHVVRLTHSSNRTVRLQAVLALHRWPGRDAAEALAKLTIAEVDDPLMLAAIKTSLDGEKLTSGYWDKVKQDRAAESAMGVAVRDIERGFGRGPSLHERIVAVVDNPEKMPDIERMRKLVEVLGEANKIANEVRFGDKTRATLQKLVDEARSIVVDAKQPNADRATACQFLFKQEAWLYSESDRRADYKFFPSVVADEAPEELRTAAWQALRESRFFPFDDLLYVTWIERPQSYRLALLDALMANEHAKATLLKMLDGQRLAAADLDASRAQTLANHPDRQVQTLARNLTKSIAISDRGDLVARFEDALKLRGDVARGRAAFRKRCTACHKQEGEGRQIGPDMASLTDKSSKALLVAMLDPNRAVEAKFIEYLVITQGGQLLSGVVTSETGTSVTLLGSDGKEHTILRKEIELLRSNRKSLMPEGLERDLTKQEFADVIAYLQATAVPPKTFEGNSPALVKSNDAGTIELLATNARIYGPKIIYETKYKNLGWWQNAEDVAEWSLHIPGAGKYRVTLDYACDASAAGDTLQLAIGGQTVLFKVASTGSWDDYTQKAIGTIELAAGPAEASVRSSGAVRSALIDLRGIKLEVVK